MYSLKYILVLNVSVGTLLSLTGFSRRTVRSTTDTLGVGTRKAMPVSLL